MSGPNINHPKRVRTESLKVLHDYLVVRPLAVPDRKHGSLMVMPGTASARDRSSSGIVVATGPGDWNETGTARVPMSIHVGDLAFFGKYAGTDEEFEGESVLVMREAECRLAVPAGDFELVVHEDPRLNHLIETWCEVCHGADARQELAAAREELLVGRRPSDSIVE